MFGVEIRAECVVFVPTAVAGSMSEMVMTVVETDLINSVTLARTGLMNSGAVVGTVVVTGLRSSEVFVLDLREMSVVEV